jgi:uncharacterized protein (DUF302 family)
MSYYFSKVVNDKFETAVSNVIEQLKLEGFGVLTDIDVQQIFKNKLGVDFGKYKILGACNPDFAYQALLAESCIGTMLPCNIIIREDENGKVQVAAVDPVASMAAIKNKSLEKIAHKVQEKLKKTILRV